MFLGWWSLVAWSPYASVRAPERTICLSVLLKDVPVALSPTYEEYKSLQEHMRTLEELMYSRKISGVLASAHGSNMLLDAEILDGDVAGITLLKVIQGRFLDLSSPEPQVVLSWGVFSRFSRDRAILPGDIINLNGKPFILVGVTPPGFQLHGMDEKSIGAWVSVSHVGQLLPPYANHEGNHPRLRVVCTVLGRLRSGASLVQATEDAKLLLSSIGEGEPRLTTWETELGHKIMRRFPALPMLRWLSGILMALVIVTTFGLQFTGVLKNLPTARLKCLLGAPWWRLCLDDAKKTTFGALLSLVLALMTCAALSAYFDLGGVGMPPLLWWSLAFLIIWLFMLLSQSALVLRQYRKLGSSTYALRESLMGQRPRLRTAILSLQFALAYLCLMLGSRYFATFQALANKPQGLDLKGVWAFEVPRSGTQLGSLRSGLLGQPGVRSVSLSAQSPLGNTMQTTNYQFPQGNQTATPFFLNTLFCDGSLGDTLSIRPILGRWHKPGELGTAVITRDLARQLWPEGSALGKTLTQSQTAPPITVVGVTDEVCFTEALGYPTPMIFRPAEESSGLETWIILAKTYGANAEKRLAQLERIPGTTSSVTPLGLNGIREGALQPMRTTMSAALLVGGIGAFIATLAIQSLLNQVTVSRRREIAIRLTLGSGHAQILLDIGLDLGKALLVGLIGGALLGLLFQRLASTGYLAVSRLAVADVVAPACALLATCTFVIVRWLYDLRSLQIVELLRGE